MNIWESYYKEKLKEFNISNLSNLVATTNFGITGQNNKALDYKDGILICGSSNGKVEVSLDYGNTFGANVVTHPFGTSQITCLVFSPVVAGMIAAITDTGVIGISTNYGATFVNLANSHGGSALNNCKFDSLGILHVCGEAGKYSHSTTSACTTMSSLINIGFGTVIADCICCFDTNTIMVSGHSNKLNKSIDGGVNWLGLITTGLDAGDSLWNVVTDNLGKVVVTVYDSTVGNKGKYIVSSDKGATFGEAISSFFTTDSIRIIRLKFLDPYWIATGDSAYFGYTKDILTKLFTRITNHPMSTGIVYNCTKAGSRLVVSGASGRIGMGLTLTYN